jgi:hypothetical protein
MVGLRGLKCRFERRGCWVWLDSSRGVGQVTLRREDCRCVTEYGTSIEGRGSGRNRWPRRLEGEGGTECVGGDKLYALRYQLVLITQQTPLQATLLQMTLKEQLTNCKRLVYIPQIEPTLQNSNFQCGDQIHTGSTIT